MSRLSIFLNKFLPQKYQRKIRSIRDKSRKYNHSDLPREIFKPQNNTYKISLCITCMNRLFHLKETIKQNILDNITYPKLEFVLINYNSKDKLHEWVQNNLSEFIEKGIVNYYYTQDPEYFHVCKAKNLSHKLASGDILINLDADNFTGKDFAFYVNYLFNQIGTDSIVQFTKPPYWGTVGRIGLHKDVFDKLGGYDESFDPIGHDDVDLLDRAKCLNFKYYRCEIENFLHYLSNTTLEKSNNVEKENKGYYNYEQSNRNISQMNIKNKIFIANPNGHHKFNLYHNFSENHIEA